MTQTRTDSIMEVVTGTAIGLVISTIANFVLLHLILGYPMSVVDNVLISAVFTVISIIRSYAIRRAFNGRSVWVAIKDKFNAHQVHDNQGAGLLSGSADLRPRRGHLVRVVANVPAQFRSGDHHDWAIRNPAS